MSLEILTLSLAGLGLGLATAVIPGPIVILLIVETLKYGWRAGAAVAAGPVIVDALIMLPLALVLQSFLTTRALQIVFGLAGMAYLLYLGAGMLITAWRPDDLGAAGRVEAISPAASFKRAVVTQMLSPMAYVFWATAGAIMVRKAYEAGGLLSAVMVPAAFWLGTLIVATGFIVVTTAGRSVLRSGAYRVVIAMGGALMAGFGVYMGARVLVG
jgi:threonine/homoserine/homoserine lactone efflux protein